MRKLPCITPRAHVEIRGVYGQPVFDFFQQVRAILALAKDEELSQFFAQPHPNAAKGEIYWYSDVPGPVQPYLTLGDEARNALDAQVLDIRRRIRDIGERFASDGGSVAGNRTEIFRAMLSATDLRRCLFLVGKQPVLCEWGCRLIGEGAGPVDLWAYGARLAEPVETVQPLASAGGATASTAAGADKPVPVPAQVAPACAEAAAPEPAFEVPDEEPLDVENPEEEPPHEVRHLPAPAPAVTKQQVLPQSTASSGPLHMHAPADHSPIASSTPHGYDHAGVRHRSLDLWDLFKRLVIAALLLALLLLLLKACSDAPVVPVVAVDSTGDEARLRKEIAELRAVATGRLADCPAKG